MNKEFPDLKYFLAEQAIKEYYRPPREIKQRKLLADFCQTCKSPRLYSVFLSLQREQLNRMAVEIILNTLPPEEKHFFEMRYRRGQQLIWIAEELHISVSQLSRSNRRILSDIQSILFYSLNPDDIFQRMKVINMLHILDMRIAALSRDGLVLRKGFVDSLVVKRQNYRQLLDVMQECMTEQSESDDPIRNTIVTIKLNNPTYNVSEISYASGISKSSVSRKLRKYMAVAYKYIS